MPGALVFDELTAGMTEASAAPVELKTRIHHRRAICATAAAARAGMRGSLMHTDEVEAILISPHIRARQI